MKSLLYFLVLTSFSSHTLWAEESNIGSSTKKVLKKVGRKARDTSCEWTEDKAKCELEKAQHQEANREDKIDTKKRKMEKATKEYEEAVEKH